MPAVEERANNVVRLAPLVRDDATLVAAARRGEEGARTEIFDRHAHRVARVLARLLGRDGELADLVHDVFVMALRDLDRLTAPAALKGWLTTIAVHTARGHIRRRKRRRWLLFFSPEQIPEPLAPTADEDTREATRATYAILDAMPANERIAFALRFIEGMELTEVAVACQTSLATIKRRLARAEAEFQEKAREVPVLSSWLEGGSRWGGK
jgi:RNA polymerase sigma-70 factor (ECF subfamily)